MALAKASQTENVAHRRRQPRAAKLLIPSNNTRSHSKLRNQDRRPRVGTKMHLIHGPEREKDASQTVDGGIKAFLSALDIPVITFSNTDWQECTLES